MSPNGFKVKMKPLRFETRATNGKHTVAGKPSITEPETSGGNPMLHCYGGLIVICYVNDIMVLANTDEKLNVFQIWSCSRFKFRNLGITKQFLKIKVHWNSNNNM